ncbi:MAG TPA: Spy/CpxP family protein refolding chaperone [Candidatus Binatia bacterium]
MKKNKTTTAFAAALIVAGLFAGAAAVADPGPGRPGMPGMMMRRMGPPLQPLMDQLQLSDDQRAEIKAIFAGSRDALRPLAVELREKHAALRATSQNRPFDESAVRAEARDIAGVQAELMVARAQMMNRVLAVLTDEQKARLAELRAERLQRFQEWRKQRSGKSEQS